MVLVAWGGEIMKDGNRRNHCGRKSYSRQGQGLKMLVALLTVVLLAAGCGSDGSSGDPEAALNAYADGINARSIDDVMAAFAEDARMVEHPLHPGVLDGKTEVRLGVVETVGLGRLDPDPYAISDVVVDGDTASWSYVWINRGGQEFCAVGNEIDVNDEGLIVEMRWGEDPGDCDG